MSSRKPVQSIRLVATDLDGTLLRPDLTVSEQTRAILERVQKAGIMLALVSARPPRILRRMAQKLGVTGLAICCNGALVYDLDREAIIQHTPLAPDVAARLVQALRNEVADLHFACECGLTFICEPGYYRLRPIRDQIPDLADALTFCQQPITKLVVLHATYSAEELAQLTAHIIGEDVLVTYSGGPFLEISAAGVHKAYALAAQCEKLGIRSEEVIVFGDMPNDLSMLNWAGHAVAVANAHPLVLAAADEITLSNAEDGVARVLERLISSDGIYRQESEK